jgi:hypothetical protein
MNTDPNANHLRLTLTYAVVLGVLVAIYRLLPYYLFDPSQPLLWNLVPVGALSLFVGSRLRGWYAFALPVLVMLVSDLLLILPLARMNQQAFSLGTPIIYASFAAYVLIGRLIHQRELSPMVIGGAALLAGVQFFLITNFVVWLRSGMYPHSFAGLMACFTAGLPFYRNTLAGDLFFSAAFFGLHAGLVWLAGRQKARQPA